MPMVPTDSESEARRFAASIAEPGARHFYDPDRRVGISFSEDYFHPLMWNALAALPKHNPYQERLAKQVAAPAREHPLWDAVLIFRPGAEWRVHTPRPDWWARQVGFL